MTFSVVVFRFRPDHMQDEEAIDALNQEVLDRVNRSGEAFLSHTRVRGRFAIRLAIGNLRTREEHVARAWALLTEAAATVAGKHGGE